jgi:hypothetical protein
VQFVSLLSLKNLDLITDQPAEKHPKLLTCEYKLDNIKEGRQAKTAKSFTF